MTEYKEQWKNIRGFEGRYMISNSGKVKSLKRKCKCTGGERAVPEKDLKIFINIAGYPSVILYINHISKTLTVHRLVAKHFCKKFSEDIDVNHKDHDKTNNWFWNLECISELENVHHYQMGRNKKSKFMNINKMDNKFRLRVTINGVRKHIGLFFTEKEAHNAYIKTLKENDINNIYA